MLKQLFLALSLLISIPCVHGEVSLFAAETSLECEKLAAAHIESGFSYLFAGTPSEALERFELANALLKDTMEENTIPIILGKIVAYDCLNMRAECEQAVGTLVILGAGYEDSESEDEEDRELAEFMRKLASIAPSKNVRKFLLKVADEL